MKLTLYIWRQDKEEERGDFERFSLPDVSPDMSFLEMLDVLNETLLEQGKRPVAFESDCREGICGTCSLVINGSPHGPRERTAACQLHMRSFKDGDTIYIEPWRAKAFPIVKDLVVNRSALDRVIEAGGYVSVNTGSAPDGNAIPVPKEDSDLAFDAATCIGCGACVAACPNGSAMLFTAAKVSHLGLLPQGQAERHSRVQNMVKAMDEQGFGGCTNFGECQEACPKGISIKFISQMNRDFLSSNLHALKRGSEDVKPQ